MFLLETPGSPISSAQFSSNGRFALATSTQNGVIWDFRRREKIGHFDGSWFAEFSQDGSRLVATRYKVPRVWDLKKSSHIDLTGHEDVVKTRRASVLMVLKSLRQATRQPEYGMLLVVIP